MYLFHFLRSFLPLRNPIGFGISDFIEFALALLLVGLLFAYAWTSGWLQKLSKRTAWCILLFAALPILLRLLLLQHCPVPVPSGADDFSYMLLGDTLAHFRLANPPHPLNKFFESVFVLQEPTYSSIYPLGQGILLAFGRLLFGNFWAGILIASGLLCASCYWMLRGWVSADWAFSGASLAVMTFGPLCQWTNSYWGGTLSAIAGCLVFGALPRMESRKAGAAVALGIGFAIQVLTRPFEFVLLGASVILFFVFVGKWHFAWKQVAVVTAFVAAALLVAGAHNKAVTSNWTTMPYMLSRYQYGVPGTFTFQRNAVPHRVLTPEQELDYRAQVVVHGEGTDSVSTFFKRLAYRARYYRFFLFAPLYVAMVMFVVTARTRVDWWLVGTVVLFALGTNVYGYFFPHYVAAETCLFVLASVLGLERLSKRYPQVSRLILLMCGAQFLFWYGLHLIAGENLWEAFRYEPWDFINYGDPEGRIAIQNRLIAEAGLQLVFVRYGPGHGFHEWIHNEADIDSARVVWALDLGPIEDAKLRSYYPNRRAWLLLPDARPPRLTPYPLGVNEHPETLR
jgi:hypothetical protein